MATRPTPTQLTVRLLRLRNRAQLAAAHRVPADSFRMLTVVGLHVDHDLTTTAGWGECSALNAPGYTSEWAEGAFELIEAGRRFEPGRYPMAAAALEMALLDLELKAENISLSERLGTLGRSAPAGAVVGIARLPELLDEVADLAAAGYSRVKIKVGPDHLIEPVEAIHRNFPELELQVDANGSLGQADLGAISYLGELGVEVIEQPFPTDDSITAAQLVAESDMEVLADEAVGDAASIDHLAQNRAATGVVIKPSKLGGLGPAAQTLERAVGAGLSAAIGGMLESGLGRHLLAALAPLPAFTVTGDLSPARRWLIDDPFPDIRMRDGQIDAPDQLGVAGEPSASRLEAVTVRSATVVANELLSSVQSN